MTDLFLKVCSDQEFDKGACDIIRKLMLQEIHARALYRKSSSVLDHQLVSFPQPDSEMPALGWVQKLTLTKTLPLPMDPSGGKILVWQTNMWDKAWGQLQISEKWPSTTAQMEAVTGRSGDLVWLVVPIQSQERHLAWQQVTWLGKDHFCHFDLGMSFLKAFSSCFSSQGMKQSLLSMNLFSGVLFHRRKILVASKTGP